jgi:hypothetical protein
VPVATVSHVASGLVGLVLLLTGALKALDSGRFVTHLRRYRLLPPGWVPPFALLFIAFECALGAALVLNLSPWLLPLAAVVLTAFIALTAWGVANGRVEDCGCYGGLVMLTPVQSLALDGLYLALLLVAWLLAPAGSPAPAAWTAAVVVAVLVGALVAAVRSRVAPLVDLALLRVGRAWRRSWLKHYTRDVTRGSHFIVFLSRECPYCKRWVPLLNVIEVQPDLPSVVAVMSLEDDELQGFLQEHLITFPVTHMPQSLVSLMANAYPTAALVENGRVTEKWVGEMPKAYLERVREFFAVVATPARQPGGGFAG